MVKLEIVADNMRDFIEEMRLFLSAYTGTESPSPAPVIDLSVDNADTTRHSDDASPVEEPTDAAMERATRKRGRKATKDAAPAEAHPPEATPSPQSTTATGEAPAAADAPDDTKEQVLTVPEIVVKLTAIFKDGSEAVRETILKWKANEELQFLKDMTDAHVPSAMGLLSVLDGKA